MNRRGFLASILAGCTAPAIVRADVLMRVVPMQTTVLRTGILPANPQVVEAYSRALAQASHAAFDRAFRAAVLGGTGIVSLDWQHEERPDSSFYD